MPITIATNHSKTEFLHFINSAKVHNLNYTVLGKGHRYKYHGSKLPWIKKELQKVKDQENLIIMFTDAYDVLIYDDASNIVEAFKKFDANVVFGTEYFCTPDQDLEKEYPEVESKGTIVSGV